MRIIMFKKKIIVTLILICLFGNNFIVLASQESKYPDYSYEFIGEDKWENLNRKVFNFNRALNKYAIRPIHTIWSSIMPEYGMDRLYGITNNIEYPIRLVSSLIQKDFQTSKNESIRFFTNTILGLGGMFDPAKHLFHLEQSKENMDQALAHCKVKSGPYFVMPVLSFTSLRGAVGKLLDMALNPSTYIASPILAMVKAGLTVNRTSYLQPLLSMVESTYADPYEITKKAYGIDNYIKQTNMDRVDIISALKVNPPIAEQQDSKKVPAKNITPQQDAKENLVNIEVYSELAPSDVLYGGTNLDEIVIPDYSAENFKINADLKLSNYNPQSPVVDSMRTVLFALPEVDKSIWNELSIWNRSFSRRIKTDSVSIYPERNNYRFRYIMQKEKQNSPLVIIYPSIGEGIMSNHSVLFAKLFYDAGFSVIIQGSHFQWEFVKSMPKNYRPGIPSDDAKELRIVTGKIINNLEGKYKCKFGHKVLIGTSFGALTSLFAASQEYKNSTLGEISVISICPPIDLIYAMKQVDKNSEEWNQSPQDFKQKIATTAAKIINFYQNKENINFEINNLPFNEEEGKLITGFIMHQKLSDLIFTIEEAPNNKNSEIYKKINNMGYQDYVKKYLLKEGENLEDLSFEISINYIEDYLRSAENYKIYHSVNDYLTSANQIKNLRQITGNKMTLIDNGAHLGFLYRKEFIEDLKNTIAQNK